MSGVYIKGLDAPTSCYSCAYAYDGMCEILGLEYSLPSNWREKRKDCPIVSVPDHGDLIDIDKLSDAMYHEAFEMDSYWQKWDSGCWIRYKMFERLRDSVPVVIPAERSEK